MSLLLVLTAVLLSALSGVPGLWCSTRSRGAQRFAAGAMTLSLASGLTGAALGFAAETAGWTLPWLAAGEATVGMDALSAFFLVPVFLVGGLGSLYGLGYWPRIKHRDGRKLEFFWGTLVAGMALLAISRNALAFLLGWEIMALSAFFLVATEDQKAETRRAAFVYLIATHMGTLTLFGLFTVWQSAAGSFDFLPAAPGQIEGGTLHLLFLLSLLGFGLKAGALPFHFWLPGAHANAPTHVSAILSGVVLKMGIYGLVRFLFLLPDPPVLWGILVLLLGGASALFGVVFALAQHDLKRLLAYHSVENIGIILLGLGMGLVGRSLHEPLLAGLGLAGCLLHVWNHSLFKSLLFLAAGSVLHGTGTRLMDRLGGLGQGMPATAALFLVGAAAIVGLPPLNGFISEFLIYLGFFSVVADPAVRLQPLALGVPVLAFAGSLALVCFVKVYGTVFLGIPRTPSAARARESGWIMTGPVAVLAAGCLVLGAVPSLAGPLTDSVLALCLPDLTLAPLTQMAPLGPLGTAAQVLLAAALLTTGLLFWRKRRRVPTWSCGYDRPTARMQYTATSFAQPATALFAWILRPHGTDKETHVNDLVLDRFLGPISRKASRWAGWFRRFQQGKAQSYIGYILATLLLLLGFLIPFDRLIAGLWAP